MVFPCQLSTVITSLGGRLAHYQATKRPTEIPITQRCFPSNLLESTQRPLSLFILSTSVDIKDFDEEPCIHNPILGDSCSDFTYEAIEKGEIVPLFSKYVLLSCQQNASLLFVIFISH